MNENQHQLAPQSNEIALKPEKPAEKEPEFKYDRNSIMLTPPDMMAGIFKSESFHAGSFIERMMQFNMPLNYKTKDRKNLLHFAVEQNDLQATRTMLISRAVDVNTEYDCFFLDTELSYLKYTPYGSALMITCAKKEANLEIVKALLDAGAYVNKATLVNPPPLFLAVRNDNKELFEYLLTRGADLRCFDMYGRNILFQAVRSGQVEFFDRLLDYGIDPYHVAPVTGSTLLHEVGKQKPKKKMLERLLDMKIFDPNRFDVTGMRPIDWICAKGDRETLDMIVKYGGNLFGLNQKGNTLIIAALRYDNLETFKALTEMGVRPNPNEAHPMKFAINLKNHEMIEYVFSLGTDPNLVVNDGDSLLAKAVKTKDIWIVDRILLTNRVSPNVRNAETQMTPLLEAAACKAPVEIFQRLLERGANVKDRDLNKETALHNAARNNQIEAVQLLLRYGADVNADSSSGYRPLDLATDVMVIQTLKQHGATTTTDCWRSCGCCFFNTK